VQVGDGKGVETMWAIIAVEHEYLGCRHFIYHFFPTATVFRLRHSERT
jgi:hypothetical protein